MFLIGFFRRKPKEVVKMAAVEYVEWLLKYMLRTSQLELTVNTRKALPGSSMQQSDNGAPPCLPDASVVINRLKILSGVNPLVRQPTAVEGRFERPRRHYTLEVFTRFLDVGLESTCVLRLRIRGCPDTCDLEVT